MLDRARSTQFAHSILHQLCAYRSRVGRDGASASTTHCAANMQTLVHVPVGTAMGFFDQDGIDPAVLWDEELAAGARHLSGTGPTPVHRRT